MTEQEATERAARTLENREELWSAIAYASRAICPFGSGKCPETMELHKPSCLECLCYFLSKAYKEYVYVEGK